MLTRILRRLYHACWYVVATIVLVTAVSVTLVRLGLPRIDNYRDNIQAWVSQYSGYSIKAEKIDASWQGWTPHLNLHGITVMDTTGTNVLTTLQSVTLSINPLVSLARRELSPLRITVTGPELVIIRSLDGSINIAEEKPVGVSNARNVKNSIFIEWLTQQHSVSIEDANIDYIDLNKQDTPLRLSNVDLHFRKASGRMQINASANLPEDYGQNLDLSLDAYGDITTPHWSGEIYVEGNDIYPATLFSMSHEEISSFQFKTAPSNIKLWSHWENGHLNLMEGTIDASEIEFTHDSSTMNIQHLKTVFSGTRNKGQGYDVKLAITDLVTINGPWPQTSVTVTKQTDINGKNDRYLARIDYLKIDDIFPFLMPLLDIEYDTTANESISLNGGLENNLLIYEPEADQPLYIKSDIDTLSVKLGDKTISSSGGQIEGNPEYGLVKMESSSLELTLPALFNNILSFHELTGDITWEKTDAGLVVKSNYIGSRTSRFNTSVKGKIIFDERETLPYVDLLVGTSHINLENVTDYLPKTIPEETRAWMDRALVSGEVSTLDVALRGPLEQFPFENNEGQFKLIANIQNAILDFDQEWVPVDKLYADLEIDNTRLIVSAQTGYIYNAEIISTEAIIDDLLADKVAIRIDGKIKGSTDDALFIIDNSPLASSDMLQEIKNNDIQGPLNLDMTLDIPFDERPTSVNGNLFFDKVILTSHEFGIKLENITGNILFTRDSVTTNKLTADYFGQPVNVNINTDYESRFVLGLEGDADGNFISNQLAYFYPELNPKANSLSNYITGTCHWMAKLSPAPSTSGETNTIDKLLTIESDLSGLVIDLPAPLGKQYETATLAISTKISNEPEREINFNYGNNLAGNIVMQHGAVSTLIRTELALGQNEILSRSGKGTLIHGKVDNISLSDWHNFINTFDIDTTKTFYDSIKINLHADVLDYHNHQFENTSFNLTNINSDWQIDIRGNHIEGGINIPADTTQQAVKAYFTKIHLLNNGNADQEIEIDIDPRTLPSLDLEADEFIYDTYQLGKLALNTTSTNSGLSVNSISFNKPDLQITGNGTWEYINDQEFSRFTLELEATKLDAMLSTFDYTVEPIKDGETKLKMNAVWHGSPMDFSLADVNGDLSMDIEKGQVMDIEPAAGRLFGLLSLQTLPRRLSLDFSDLFSKGFTFDKISGIFTIESGNAYTNNLSMTGPSANVNITGRTGLIVKDYDQVVTVTPQVSNSIPVASALFGPIGVGVGAVIFLAGELFESIPKQIDKLLSYQYTIRGSWDEPVVEKYGNATEPSG